MLAVPPSRSFALDVSAYKHPRGLPRRASQGREKILIPHLLAPHAGRVSLSTEPDGKGPDRLRVTT